MPYCMQCGHLAERAIPVGDTRPRLVCPACDYIHYDNPKLVCGCILVHDDKVLLCRRAIEPQYGKWTLPAGFMEIGESMQDGSNRECREEAEAMGKNLQLFAIIEVPHIGQIHVMYLGDLADGKFGIGEESLECALFGENEIPWDELAFESGIRALHHYFADKHMGQFTLHSEVLAIDKALKKPNA